MCGFAAASSSFRVVVVTAACGTSGDCGGGGGGRSYDEDEAVHLLPHVEDIEERLLKIGVFESITSFALASAFAALSFVKAAADPFLSQGLDRGLGSSYVVSFPRCLFRDDEDDVFGSFTNGIA